METQNQLRPTLAKAIDALAAEMVNQGEKADVLLARVQILAELETLAPDLVARAALEAREAGHTWATIARGTGKLSETFSRQINERVRKQEELSGEESSTRSYGIGEAAERLGMSRSAVTRHLNAQQARLEAGEDVEVWWEGRTITDLEWLRSNVKTRAPRGLSTGATSALEKED